MTQRIPFYFVAQLSAAFLAIALRTYLFGSYILPAYTALNLSRIYVSAL